MKSEQSYRKIFSSCCVVLYLFVALFSQNFHNHGSGLVFKDFNFKKSEKTFTESHLVQEFTDCLSCHFLHDGLTLIPDVFKINFNTSEDFRKEIFAYQQRFSVLEIFCFNLRGPPSDFI